MTNNIELLLKFTFLMAKSYDKLSILFSFSEMTKVVKIKGRKTKIRMMMMKALVVALGHHLKESLPKLNKLLHRFLHFLNFSPIQLLVLHVI